MQLMGGLPIIGGGKLAGGKTPTHFNVFREIWKSWSYLTSRGMMFWKVGDTAEKALMLGPSHLMFHLLRSAPLRLLVPSHTIT